MCIPKLSCAAALAALTACSAGSAPGNLAVFSSVAAPQALSPDLRLEPPVLRFKISSPKSKTEEVFRFEPGGVYHETCEGLGVAHIEMSGQKGHNAFFQVTPDNVGRCVIGFVHNNHVKNLEVVVRK